MKVLQKQIKPQMDANQTRILRGPHITALLEDWWTGRRPEKTCSPANRAAA